jgi:cytochrome c553
MRNPPGPDWRLHVTHPSRWLRAATLVVLCTFMAACMTKQTVGNDASIEGTLHVCSSCHGLEGRSTNPTFPILAAQQHDYLVTQLKSFRDKTRADPHAHTYMWGMAAKLDDATIEGVASFFASQKAADGTAQDPVLVAAGATIFKNGIDARNVPACSACHGDDAHGNGAVPRLASQHPGYLADQLHAFQINSRANEMMHHNAENLTQAEINELAAYLASL